MGAGYTVGEDAIANMESTKGGLDEAKDLMKQYVTQLRGAFDENRAGLGEHTDSISGLLDDLESATSDGDAKVLKLVLKLTKAIAIRKIHVEEDIYSSGRSK